MFGEKKTWENVQCILVSKLYPDSFVPLFHFHRFDTTPLILLVKVTLIRNCKSVEGDWFRWANACVQVDRR